MIRTAVHLLRLLADGQPHTAAELIESFPAEGPARPQDLPAVLRAAADMGLILVHTPAGIALERPLDLLDPWEIGALLPEETERQLVALTVFPQTDSTNERILAQSAGGDVRGMVAVAEFQRAGRGRRGKAWVQPYAAGVCLSLGWSFPEAPAGPNPLSLVAGIAVVRALTALGVTGLTLKWPNDVLHEGAKLAGILVEARMGTGERPWQVAVGVGVNHHLSPLLRAGVDQPAADLVSIMAVPPRRARVVAALAASLVTALQEYEGAGFAPFAAPWAALDGLCGREVTIHDEAAPVVMGRALGVTADGALLVEGAGGLVCLHGGQVTIREVLA